MYNSFGHVQYSLTTASGAGEKEFISIDMALRALLLGTKGAIPLGLPCIPYC